MSWSEQPRYYRVVVNSAGQYGIWPIRAQPPTGWALMPFAGDYHACAEQIRQLTELRHRRCDAVTVSRTIHTLRQIAAHAPAARAVSARDAALTRAELLERADDLAAQLRSGGIGPSSLVLVAAEPSADLIVALLALLIAHASCVLAPSPTLEPVPVGVGFVLTPADWSAATALAGDTTEVRGASGRPWLVSPIEKPSPVAWCRPGAAVTVAADDGQRLVPWRDRQLLRFAATPGEPIGSGQRLRLRAAPGHPAFPAEVLHGLLTGAELTLLPDSATDQGASTTWYRALERGPDGLVRCLFPPRTSDELPRELFGFPETGLFVATGRSADPARLVLAPLPDSQLYVLDDDLRPVPAGDSGWLSVGGAGVTEGYLDGPEVSLRRFLPDPMGPAGELMFWTGLRCRRRKDGTVELLDVSHRTAGGDPSPGGAEPR